MGIIRRIPGRTRREHHSWSQDFLTDCRLTWRTSRRAPAYAGALILTIALGVGVNTAVWSVMDALLRRSLPVQHPDQLHTIRRMGNRADGSSIFSHPLMKRMQQAAAGDAPIAGMGTIARFYATVADRPEAVLGQGVSGNFFSMLGVGAAEGRTIRPSDDEQLGASPVVVISDAFWRRRFGRSPETVGRRIRLNGFPVTIVGVLPAGFGGLTVGSPVDVFVPLAMQHELKYKGNVASFDAEIEKPWVPQDGISWLVLITRVKPESRVRLQSRLDVAAFVERDPTLVTGDSADRARLARERIVLEAIPRGFSSLRGQFENPLRVLAGGVMLILLITCANVAGVVLARGEARAPEMVVRSSLGAPPGRLVRQVTTETLILAMVGGGVGLLMARWATQALLVLASTGTQAIPLDARLDARGLAFAFAVTLMAGLMVGVAPALRVRRLSLHAGERSTIGASRGAHRLPLGRLLVIAQIALSLVLVTAAGVFVQTFRNLVGVDTGFEREQVVTARLELRAAGYRQEQLPAVHEQLLNAAQAVPGVLSASLAAFGLGPGPVSMSGFRTADRSGADDNIAQENQVSPGYFRTVGIPLLRGREFNAFDTRDRPRVAVVTESFARHFFGTTDVIGRRFGYDAPDVEIVGVARDVRVNGLKSTLPRMVYRALAQGPDQYAQSLDVRVANANAAIAVGLRNAIASVDPDLPVREIVAMEDYLERSLSRERLLARLAGAFGILALIVAAVGVYGVVSYSVTRRKSEMGVRLALGASPARVTWLVLKDSLLVICAGLALGTAAWYPAMGLTESLVFGVSPHDASVLGAGGVILLVAATIAGIVPALRAARTDPISAIRVE